MTLRGTSRLMLLAVALYAVIGLLMQGTQQVVAQTTPQSSSSAVVSQSSPTPKPSPSPESPELPLNLTISPVTINWDTLPGQTATTSIKIRNNSTEPENLGISFGTFKADETGSRPILLDPDPNAEFMRWISVSPAQFTIKPGEWQDVSVTFSPPDTAALSYYYTIQINRMSGLQAPGSTTIQGSPAVLVLSTVVSPNAVRSLEVSEFTITRGWHEFLPIQMTVKVRNTGNVHSVPQGNIFIDGQGKKDLAILSLNQGQSAVLPGSERTFTVVWDDGFPMPILDTADATTGLRFWGLNWDFARTDRLRFGKYDAHLLLVYDNGQRDVPIESFASTWVIPWRLMGVVLLVGLFALLGLRSVIFGGWRGLRRIFRGAAKPS